MPLSVFTQTIPGCGGVCAEAVAPVDFGRAVPPSVEAGLLDLVEVGEREFAEAAVVVGAACAEAFAALDFRDCLLGLASLVGACAVVVADLDSSAVLDLLDLLLAGPIVLALALVAVLESSVVFVFRDFLADFGSLVLASAVVLDFESSAAFAFFVFFALVLLLWSELVVAALWVVPLGAEVPDASVFFFLAAAANAGVSARQSTSIRIAVKGVRRRVRKFIDPLLLMTSGGLEPPRAIAGYFLEKKRTIEVRITAPRMAIIMV